MSAGPARSRSSWASRCTSATVFTGVEGTNVPVDETVEAFEKLLDGEFDELPEQAFFNVGGIDDVQAKANQLKNA